MANIITIGRIVLSILMLFCPVFSWPFYIVYVLCGITDVIDGITARKFHLESELGARLDTISDIVFSVLAIIKLLPVISLPGYCYTCIFVIAAIKLFNIVFGFIEEKKFVSVHSVMNKITGTLLFLFPLSVNFINTGISSFIVCAMAFISALNETGTVIKSKVSEE